MPTINTNIDVDIDFEVYCDECGEGICKNVDVNYDYNGKARLYIQPCKNCLEKAYSDGAENNELGNA